MNVDIILFTVKCDFEVGFCGLKHESKSLRWFIASGFTLEKNSLRPSFDHTTFLPTGRLNNVRATVLNRPLPPFLFHLCPTTQPRAKIHFPFDLLWFSFICTLLDIVHASTCDQLIGSLWTFVYTNCSIYCRTKT